MKIVRYRIVKEKISLDSSIYFLWFKRKRRWREYTDSRGKSICFHSEEELNDKVFRLYPGMVAFFREKIEV